MILVTGAAGKTGTAVIRALFEKHLPVRALVHREAQVETAKSAGADEVIVGDMLSKVTLAGAVQGADAIYHICPNVSSDELSIGKAVIESARAAKVKQFTFHSVLHPQVESMPHHWHKLHVEEALFESGLQFTILQPAAYMQNILGEWQSIMERGVYRVPYSIRAPMSLVDLEDIAQVAAAVLSQAGHSGSTYELAGPEVLTPNQIAMALTNHLERDVRAEQIPIETWRRNAERAGLGQYQVDTLAKMFEYYDRYGLCGNSRILENLLGRDPTTFTQFLERTPS